MKLFILYLSGFIHLAFPPTDKQPKLYTNNFTHVVTEGEFVNCRKIKDLTAVIYLDKDMEHFDNFKVEFHRSGEDGDVLVASKTITPGSKEYTKKYAGKDSVQLKLLTKENEWNTSDFLVNTMTFDANPYVNNVYCDIHEKKHVNFYLIVRGYTKTGEKDNFGTELYTGSDISPKSVVFVNWIFPK